MNQPQFQGVDVVYKSKADNKDIRDLLEKLVPKAKAQMKDFSIQFKGRNDGETCKNIFTFLSKLTYVADGDEQIIKLPSALLRKRIGDCKSFSLFTSSILENLKIPYTFVYASYNANPIPHHVYVITEKGCIIDVVYGTFNKEKKPNFKYTKNMNVRYMGGLDCDDCGVGLGKSKKRQDRQDKRKDKRKRRGGGGKTILLSPGRALFLVLIKKNLDGLATKLSQMNANTIMGYWNKVGGNKTKFMSAIKKGASKPQKRLGLLAKIKKIIGNKKISGIGEIDSGVSSSIIALCTSIGGAIGGVGGAANGASMGAVIVGILPIVASITKKVPQSQINEEIDTTNIDIGGEVKSEIESEEEGEGGGGGASNVMKYLPFLAIGGVALYLITKKK